MSIFVFEMTTLITILESIAISSTEVATWSTILTNQILVVFTAIVFFIEIASYNTFIPNFVYSFSTINTAISIENNYVFSRSREYIALSFVLVVSIIVDKYRLYPLKTNNPEYSSLIIIAILAAYIALRYILSLIFKAQRLGFERRLALRKTPHSYFIILGIAFFLTTAIAWLFKIEPQVVRIILYAEILLIYLFSIIRTYKILRLSYTGISSFLYLCALEFLPTAVLILSTRI